MTKENENKLEYGRIVLGFGWPAERAGYVVAIGEEPHPMIRRKIHKLHFEEEIEEWDLGDLLDCWADLVKKYGDAQTYGRRDKDYMGNIWSWNDRHPGSELSIWTAPHSKEGKIGYHIHILVERLKNGTLILPKDSIVWNQLRDAERGQTHLATDAQFPAVAALGYVVAGLDRNPPEPEQEEYVDLDEVNKTTGY
jgi:hypothetical protein